MDERIINRKLAALQSLSLRTIAALDSWQIRLADHKAPGQYEFVGAWRKESIPMAFPAGRTAFMRSYVEVPADAAIADTYLAFGIENLEGQLSIDGVPYCGLDGHHARICVPRA